MTRWHRLGFAVIALLFAATAVRYALQVPSDWLVLFPTVAPLLVIAGTWLTRHDDPEPRS